MFRIKEINVIEVKKRFNENFSFTLLDVIEHHEVEFAKIKDHAHIPMGRRPVRHEEMDKKTNGCYVSYRCSISESMSIFRILRIQCKKLKKGGVTPGLFLLIQPSLDINV